MRVLFVVPGRATGGGVHSVVQEATGLRRLGLEVRLATPPRYAASYAVAYPRMQDVHQLVVPFENCSELAQLMAEVDVVVGTVYTSIATIKDSLEQMERQPAVAYYVQDYEPLFCEPGSPEWEQARSSYTLIKGMTLFAKTAWLRDIVFANHLVPVQHVEASIDHEVYFPDLSRPRRRGGLGITAMLRPSTPRRAPYRTARLFNWLATKSPTFRLDLFGVEPADIRGTGIELDPAIQLHGQLRREQVAGLLRAADVFVDASDYQAFGRTGLEAMACGCVPILPTVGGAADFVDDAVNGLLVDTTSDESVLDAVSMLATLSDTEFDEMRYAAIRRASGYSVHRAAVSEAVLFTALLQKQAATTSAAAQRPS